MTAATKIRKWYPIAAMEDIPLKEGKRIYWSGQEIALFNLGDA